MIPGITTRSRLPRLGKIRLGEKRQSKGGKEYPAALDHFNLADAPDVEKVFGKECRELSPVLIPVEDEETFFPTARKAYRRSGLFCACDDGETARRVYVPVTKEDKGDPQGQEFVKANGLEVEPGEMFEMPCPGESCPYFEQGFCKNVGRLMFMLPTVAGFGVWEISTSSYNSIVNVLSTVRSIKAVAGRVSGIPFALQLVPQQVQASDGKAKTVHVLNLKFPGSIFDLQKAKAELGGGRIVALLEAGKDLTPDDLYPRAGAALDAKLSPKAQPAAAHDEAPPDDAESFLADIPSADDLTVKVCGCPCGCQKDLTQEVADASAAAVGAPRCIACFPGAGFVLHRHLDVKDLKLPKYPGYTPAMAETRRLDIAKKAGGAR